MAYEVASKETDPVRPRNRDHHVVIWTSYAVAVVAVFVAAVIATLALHGSAFMWGLTLFGAVVISVVLSGGAVPHLRDRGNQKVAVSRSTVQIREDPTWPPRP